MDKHYIVLNGKRYDAVTGALLGPDTNVTAQPVRKAAAATVHGPRTASSPRAPHAAPQSVTQTTATKTSAPSRRPHETAPAAARRKQQPSKTLMRRAVKKPSASTAVPMKKHYPIMVTASGITVEAPKRLAHNVDENRAKRSQSVHKSTKVGRYAAPALAPVQPRVAPLTVREQPAHLAAPKVVTPAKTATPPKQSAAPKKIDVFEQAIANATAHEQKAPKGVSRRRRAVNAVTAVAAVLVVAGAAVALNQSAIEMQLASMQAGFQANEPRYLPEGFEKSSATVAGKAVALNYASGSGTYTLTQESSTWDSQTLFDSISAIYGDQYDIAYDNGRIIYLYGNSEASWVNGGILYTLKGNGTLTNDQIVDIASSL